MDVNWAVIATVASPIIALFVGAILTRFIERRPRLIAYFTHASAFDASDSEHKNPLTIHTHGIVIKNIGKNPATDIRIRHNLLPPRFNVFPRVEHQVHSFPGGGAEIVIPILVQNEQVAISYLYFPPLLYNQIHAGIRHSDGFAEEVTALPTPQYAPWIKRGLWVLLVLGIIASAYLLFEIFSLIPGILKALVRLKSS